MTTVQKLTNDDKPDTAKLPVFRVAEGDTDSDIAWQLAALLRDDVRQKKSGMRNWRWSVGTGRISDGSVIKALSTRARFEKLDSATNTWRKVPCPMGYAMRVGSALYYFGGTRP